MRSKSGVYALLALMPLFFASNIVIGRASAGLVEPWTLAFWRWTIAAILLLPFAWTGLARSAPALRSLAGEITILGLLGMFVCGGAVYVSLHWTTATNAALIYTGSTLFIVVLDALIFRQPLTFIRVCGLLAGFLGVATIVLQGQVERLLTLELNLGDLGIAVCAFSWALYSVLLKAERFRALPTLPLFAAIAAAGALTLAPPMLYEAFALSAFPASLPAWASILALAIVPSVLAYGIYQLCIKEVGPSITGVFLYLMPVYAAVLAALALGERFHAYHAAGLVLVVGGVLLATDPVARRAKG